MPKSLVIVESDAKSKTINRYLGKEFLVRASVGHIKNLPKNRLGVDIENGFEPEYITIRGKGKVLRELKRLAHSSDTIYIATDPDREGEAIAQHLAEEIESFNPKICRVLFHEITESAINEAIRKPLEINLDKVEAQKARRVLDRLVGYQVSPFLWKTIFRGLSAGRVQTVALRLICEREEEVLKFVAQEYWSIEADFVTKGKDVFRSKLVKFKGDDAVIADETAADTHRKALEELKYKISDVRTKDVEKNPYPPYTTSTLQQDGVKRLGMTTKQIMAIAQQLYEGIDLPEGRVGLITYMRTDSTRLAETAVAEGRQYIADNYGLEYVPEKPRTFKNKKSAQDAHEAIRPTSMKSTPHNVGPHLNPNQKKLYELIWNRFLASQMASARVLQTTVEIVAGDYLFRTTGSVIQFRGFLQLYTETGEDSVLLPEGLAKGGTLTLKELFPQQHFTKPPARYNESSLVKELDNLGIGRPSTYSLIISTLLDRRYVDRENRILKPTELGTMVHRIVVGEFPNIFEVGFTARMEEELDQIESREKDRKKVLEDFWVPFSEAVKKAQGKQQDIKESLQEEQGEKCPKCGKELVAKWGRNGRFVACTGYPECRYTRPLDGSEQENAGTCDKCGAALVVKAGRYGRFLACSAYPDCTFTKSFSTGVKCPEPECGGDVVEKRSRRGKMFFGCSNYPKCHFASWYRLISTACTKCGFPLLEERSNKTKGAYTRCRQCENEIPKEPQE